MGIPAATPVTIPLPEPTVANVVLLLLQVPPPASLKVTVAPAHTTPVPVIPAGRGFTVTTLIAVAMPQILVAVYFIVSVPVPAAVTTPVEEPIVAVVGVTEVQTPPPAPSLRVIVAARHMFPGCNQFAFLVTLYMVFIAVISYTVFLCPAGIYIFLFQLIFIFFPFLR